VLVDLEEKVRSAKKRISGPNGTVKFGKEREKPLLRCQIALTKDATPTSFFPALAKKSLEASVEEKKIKKGGRRVCLDRLKPFPGGEHLLFFEPGRSLRRPSVLLAFFHLSRIGLNA